MAGIYIHIPFCKQKCSYCDFHFSTDLSYRQRMVEAIAKEIEVKSERLGGEAVETIYFGGGTPSMLNAAQVDQLMRSVREQYRITSDAEVTLEANPDDITEERLQLWRRLGVNRLSIGIQSFDSADLERMNRAHTAEEAARCIPMAHAAGFDNITVDMIYGLPDADMAHFERNLQQFIDLGVGHISAYNLTIEEGTLFHHQQKKGALHLPSDEAMAERFILLRDRLAEAGYEQYEVSNFAREGNISRHNSAYWLRRPYLGIGPSAHGYDGQRRYWNIANNHRYMQAIEAEKSCEDYEELTVHDRYNDYVLTRLRTKWGIDLGEVERDFGIDILRHHSAALERRAGLYTISDAVLRLTPEGLLQADGISADLFVLD